MDQPRPSSFGAIPEEESMLNAAKALNARLESANLQLLHNVEEFNNYRMDPGLSDLEDIEMKDPAIVAVDVAAQMSFLRKLKFQYIEQNAKDKYVKSIVSDIDDAPIVTAEDNKHLLASNAEKKEKLKVAKASLSETQQNIRTLAPLVEEDYRKAKEAADEATTLAQKIIDARLALTRLRKTHPHPRLTIPLADQKLMDQVTEMQTLSDEAQSINKEIHARKGAMKTGALEVERLRMERTEVEKTVKASRIGEDDPRLVPLYDWYTASMTLHRSIINIHDSYSASENELHLTYNIDVQKSKPHQITITLIFTPETRHLAAVQVVGLDELGVDVGEIIDVHIQLNDAHGLVAAILNMARAGAASTISQA